MASTRESTPTHETGSSTPQLTPNSKIKAMLAALDDSDKSEQEEISGSARARLVKSLIKPTVTNIESRKGEHPDAQEDISTSGEEDEEEVGRPRGRLAAAMRAQAPQAKLINSGGKSTRPRESPTKALRTQSHSLEPTSENDAASEEIDVPVVSRKRKIRESRHTTPEPSPEENPQSPGLFVSPTAADVYPTNTLDSDEAPENLSSRDRVKALVEKKRRELQAREKEADELKAKKAAERRRHEELLDEDELDRSDDEGARRLTQQMKPTRKASKKALEEMHRETQRLSRNQQLAHYATTKKKFLKTDFLKRFNRPTEKTPELPAQQINQPPSSSPIVRSDIDMKDTPPTSPSSAASDHRQKSLPPLAFLETSEKDKISQLPSSPMKQDKGKGKMVEELSPNLKIAKATITNHRSIRVRVAGVADRKISALDDSDSDLEIVSVKATKTKKRLEEVFNRIPAKKSSENQSLYTLRMLAHLTSPGKQNLGRNKKPSMTTSEMQMSLQQQARQQATREREERLQAARDRGVIIQTAEEREQEMAEVEDLLSKARREGEEITKREKAMAKKLRKESGEADPLGDSSDDEDWEEDAKKAPVEPTTSDSEAAEEESGSDADASGEEDEDEMELDDDVGKYAANPLVDNEASETEDDEEVEVEDDHSADEEMAENGDVDEDEEDLPVLQQKSRSRKAQVISDDEDESHDERQSPLMLTTVSPVQFNSVSPHAPTSVLRSATKTFIPGLTVTGPVGLGLTQIFAGTMDDSQIMSSPTDTKSQPQVAEKDALAFLRRIPAPELPPFIPTLDEETQAFPDSQSQASHIPESQAMVEDDTQGLELSFTQSQIHGFDSLISDSQMTPYPELTQDVGFAHMTPIRGRFVDSPATAIPMARGLAASPEATEETPIVKKKGRLQRRAPVVFSDDDDAVEPINLEEDFEINESLFDVMRKASKPKKVVVDEFDKKKSKAKEMVNEQAEESEDEYAGLGGASDDDSGSEADEYLKEMIDDAGGQNVDMNKLAAFYADRERANDEKQVEKLYKDITSGMMRRKRGADYDLSDSDDGGEARRRMKRREFAKMRKALLADERIGKIAENPKRQAFLRAIEDRGSDDETNFLDEFPEQEEEYSQSQSEAQSEQVIPNSQPGDMGPPKRKRSEDSQETEQRLPPNLRRTKPVKKPSNLSEIRESLSSLIEEPNSMIAPADSGSESELELEIEGEDDLDLGKEKEKENRDPFALRRTKPAIIDRISLKCESSSTISNNTRLAFATSASALGFKVPALLRRATTNSSITSVNSSVSSGGMSTTERTAGAGGENIKRGGGKNSGVHYFARESERREKIKKTEDRREKKRFKGVEARRKVVGGLFGKGKFD